MASERSEQTDPTPQEFDEEVRQREIEAIQEQLELIVHKLKSWHNPKNFNSIATQRYRRILYIELSKDFEELLRRSKEISRNLVLTAGDQEIETVWQDRSSLGIINRSVGETVEPYADLLLVATETYELPDELTGDTFYIGDFSNTVGIVILAEAVSNGAEIKLVPVEVEEE